MNRNRTTLAALAFAIFASGCAATSPQSQNGFMPTKRAAGPHDPIILLGYSQMTGDGLRIAAKIDPGTYPLKDVAVSIATTDAGDPAPTTIDETGKPALAATSTEKGRFDSKDEEIEFTIGRGGLAKIKDRVVWYRWTVRYDRDGTLRMLQSPIFRTSRDEAGLPRAAEQPGPDVSIQPGPTPSAKR